MESPALQLHNYEPHNYTIPAALTRACQQDACRIRCLVRSCMARLQRVHWPSGRQKWQFKAQLKGSLWMWTWWTLLTVKKKTWKQSWRRGKVTAKMTQTKCTQSYSHHNLSFSDCTAQPSKSLHLETSCSEIHWTAKTKILCLHALACVSGYVYVREWERQREGDKNGSFLTFNWTFINLSPHTGRIKSFLITAATNELNDKLSHR